jgi:hypothetical protein
MRAPQVALLSLAAAMMARDSVAEPDGGAARVVIPAWVEEDQLPAFDAEPFPVDKSKAPKLGEWKDAPHVRLSRVAPRVTGCHASRIREWINVHCDRHTAGLRLVAGSTEGIALWVPEALPGDEMNKFSSMGRFGEIVFPVRPGDRRVFEWFDIEAEYEGWGSQSSLLLEEQWRPGARPEIALLTP